MTYRVVQWATGLLGKEAIKGVPIICILDCCRTNIGDNRWPHGDPAKNDGALSNVCIMYATANGHVAKDGNNSTNGVFTERLLRYMDSHLTLIEVSIAIANDLKEDEQVYITSIL